MKPAPHQPLSPPDQEGSGDALRIVLVYAAFAGLWIALSDKAVVLLLRDSAAIAWVSTLKGWLFVAITSLLLYGLIRRLAGGLQNTVTQLRQRETDLQTSECALLEAQTLAGLGSYVLDVPSGV